MGSFKSQEIQGINDESNYFLSGWFYFFVIYNKSVVSLICFERCNLELSKICNSPDSKMNKKLRTKTRI